MLFFYHVQIIDRYFFKEFLKNFAGALFALVLIAQVTKITESLGPVLGYEGPPSTIVRFYLLYIPVYVMLITAPALLFAVSVTVANFFNSNEMAVIMSGGRSLLRVLAPIMIFSAFLTIFLFFFSEFVTYPATYDANRIWRTFAWSDYDKDEKIKEDLMVRSHNRFYTISRFVIHENKAEGIHLVEISDKYIPMKIFDFERASIINGKWVFYDGIITRFNSDGSFHDQQHYEEYKSQIDDPAEYFWDEGKRFEEKNIFDLRREMKIRNDRGETTLDYLIEYYSHFSFPIVALILAVVGSLLGKHLKRGAMAISFAVTTVVSVVYFLVMFFGKSLGVGGYLPAWIAGWLANIIFAVIISYLIYREWRYN